MADVIVSEVQAGTGMERLLAGVDDAGRMMRMLLEASPMAVVVIDLDTTVRLWNAAAERIFQWKASEILGQPVPFNPESKQLECLRMREAAWRGETSSIETLRLRRDGSPVEVKLFTSPMRDAQGAIVQILVLAEDITGRRLVEAEARRSEHQFRNLLDTLSAAAYICDANGLITYFNEAAVRVWGRKPKLNDPVDRFCGSFKLLSAAGEQIRHDQCWMAVALRQNKPIEHEEIIIEQPDGSRRTVTEDVRLLRDESGRTLGAVNVLSDITDTKQATRKSRLYEVVLASIPDLVYIFDLNHRFTYANPALLAMWGKTWDEAIGKTCLELGYEPWLASVHDEEIGQIIATQQPIHGESSFKGTQGLRFFDYIFIPVLGPDGKVEAIAGIKRDITERKERITAQIRSEKLAAIGRLASAMAHEINNPLEAVTNLIWLLRTNPVLPPQTQEYLKMADEELARVSHLAKMTLSFYRSNAKPRRLHPAELVEDVLGVFVSRLRNKSITVHRRLDRNCEVSAIDGELRQAITNLVNNSIDAVAQGGNIRVCVTCAERTARKGVRITVIDDGPGIAPANRGRIFEPFFSTKPETGTGIGLSVTKEIIEKHDGSIRVRSSVRDGQSWTAFSVFLPDAVKSSAD